MRRPLSIMCFWALIALPRYAVAQGSRYVDDDAALGGDGQSWASAYRFLQDALFEAAADPTIAEIRVAGGTYRPDEDAFGIIVPGDRTATFAMRSSLALRGGFACAGAPDPDEQDSALYESILSGDLAGNDVGGPQDVSHAENSYHVVTADGVDDLAALEGFSIAGGRADGPSDQFRGGGLFVQGGGPQIQSCRFLGNLATQGGGAHVSSGDASFAECDFEGNLTVSMPGETARGGGLYAIDAALSLNGCSFLSNGGVFGGGLYTQECVSNAIDCEIVSNSAPWGAGWMNEDSPATSPGDCLFMDNTATGFALGGGMRNWTSNLVAANCTFVGNSALGGSSKGGGLYISGNERGKSAALTDCTFASNSSESGGGVYISPALEGTTTLIRCQIVQNTATVNGGGVYYFGTTAGHFLSCTFWGNQSGDRAGGLWCSQGANAVVVNCAFGGNSAAVNGGAVVALGGAYPHLVNCTLSNNSAGLSGGGVYGSGFGSPTLLNCILWGNYDSSGMPESAQVYMVDGAPIIHGSCIENWSGAYGGTGNFASNPLFVDPDGPDDLIGTADDDLRLLPGSPCIDAAINPLMPRDVFDLDGDGDLGERTPSDLVENPRFVDAVSAPDVGLGAAPLADLGAYEFVVDCNDNGISDETDISSGGSLDCDASGVPDECEAPNDCNMNGACDADDVAGGGSADCNGNSVPDECETDCNNNGEPDECDVSSGRSSDCNADGIPDECISGVLDCNGNGEIDACEVAAGQVPDVNGNGVPDTCEPEVLFVSQGASGADNGTSWEDAFSDLQAALAVARDSAGAVEQIWVAAGVYTPAGPDGDPQATFDIPNAVKIFGGFAGGETSLQQRDIVANATILSGDLNGDDAGGFGDLTRFDNAFHVVMSRETSAETVLDGFTITGGYATPLSPVDRDRGAGLWNDGLARLANCRFTNNYSVGDGGAFFNNGQPTLVDCVFAQNRSEGWGGGMFNDGIASPMPVSPVIVGCRFIGNEAIRGGGMAITWSGAEPWLANCTLLGNHAIVGGGAYLDNNCKPTFVNCLFSGNVASGGVTSRGGAISSLVVGWAISNCTFTGNHADWRAGGVYASTNGDQWLSNCIFWENTDGSGMNQSSQFHPEFGEPTSVNYSCIMGLDGSLGGVGNISLDPMFLDADGPDNIPGTDDDNLRLSAGSPCIDSASNLDVPADAADLDGDCDTDEATPIDLDGHSRFFDDPATPDAGAGEAPIVDMGTYEFAAGPAPPAFAGGDMNCDGVVDGRDIAPMVLAILDAPAFDEAHPCCTPSSGDLNQDGMLDASDVPPFAALLLSD